jgi:hypothetical protein
MDYQFLNELPGKKDLDLPQAKNQGKRMKITKWILVVSMALCMTACGWSNKEKAEQWLYSFPQTSARIDVSGKWTDPGGGYDYDSGYAYGQSMMLLFQTGTTLTGSFRGKEVMGIVSYNNVYLTAMQNGAVYFTLHLTYDAKTEAMFGKSCEFFRPHKTDKCPSIVFVR